MLAEASAQQKLAHLEQLLRDMGSVLVAYSAGVDSTFLLRVAVDTLGNRCLGVTARSDSYPERELEEATRLAQEMGARHLVVDTDEMQTESYVANPSNRCYFCKTELWDTLTPIAAEQGLAALADGFNVTMSATTGRARWPRASTACAAHSSKRA